jgi:putative aldouronate transport system substrate-binding protein
MGTSKRIVIGAMILLFLAAAGWTTGRGEPKEVVAAGLTLTYWAPLSDRVSPLFKNLNDTELYKRVEQITGVHILFRHPPVGQESEQFNLLIASKDLPDILENNFFPYPGGPEKAIADGVILRLNDLIDKHAPNLKKRYRENPFWEKLAKTDSGTHYTFPFIRGDDSLLVFFGPQFRQDWLTELKLQVPVTIDDWYQLLKAFRDRKNATDPFSFMTWMIGYSGAFVGAYGVTKDFYVEQGKVHFGPMEPGYRQFLELFNKWYAEKLIDQDFAAGDWDAFDAKVTGGKTGSYLGFVGGAMGRYLDIMGKTNPEFKLVAGPYPVLKAGETPKFGQRDWPVYPDVYLTTANKHPEESAKWLDFAYGEQGHMLFNFGIEGQSYTMVNGYPKFTDWVLNNPEGIPLTVASSKFTRSEYDGPFVQDKRVLEQDVPRPEQQQAMALWRQTDGSRRLPPLTPTEAESTRIANIMNEVNTYVDEMFPKFIMGQVSLDTWDEYVARLRSMGIEEALTIQQAALERFAKR